MLISRLQREQFRVGPGSASISASGTWSAIAPMPWLATTSKPASVTSRIERRGRSGSGRRASARARRDVTGQRLGEHQRRAAARPAGSAHRRGAAPGHRRQGLGRRVHHLEHPVAQHHVDPARHRRVRPGRPRRPGARSSGRPGPARPCGAPGRPARPGWGRSRSAGGRRAARAMAMPPVPPPRSTMSSGRRLARDQSVELRPEQIEQEGLGDRPRTADLGQRVLLKV